MPRPRRPLPALILVAVAGVLSGCAAFTGNLQTVRPGRFYRAGQMNAARLEDVVRGLGVRTVVNLRGAHPQAGWWRDEVAVCRRLGVLHHDLSWSRARWPEPASLERFVGILEAGPEPILVHCQAGVHRAAVAAALFRLKEGEPVARARRELGLLFLGAEIGGVVDAFEGSEEAFADWVRKRYPACHAAHESGTFARASPGARPLVGTTDPAPSGR